MKISSLFDYGFQPCPYIAANKPLTSELVNQYIEKLTDLAGKKHLPIDGIVMIFDSLYYKWTLLYSRIFKFRMKFI